MGLRDLLETLRRMLAQPHLNSDHAVNVKAKAQIAKDIAEFEETARAMTEKYAKQ
jgi:ubiquitin-protein ligase